MSDNCVSIWLSIRHWHLTDWSHCCHCHSRRWCRHSLSYEKRQMCSYTRTVTVPSSMCHCDRLNFQVHWCHNRHYMSNVLSILRVVYSNRLTATMYCSNHWSHPALDGHTRRRRIVYDECLDATWLTWWSWSSEKTIARDTWANLSRAVVEKVKSRTYHLPFDQLDQMAPIERMNLHRWRQTLLYYNWLCTVWVMHWTSRAISDSWETNASRSVSLVHHLSSSRGPPVNMAEFAIRTLAHASLKSRSIKWERNTFYRWTHAKQILNVHLKEGASLERSENAEKERRIYCLLSW